MVIGYKQTKLWLAIKMRLANHLINSKLHRMQRNQTTLHNPESEQASSGCLKIAVIVLLTAAISIGGTFWILTKFVFPQKFTPVELSKNEQSSLDEKLLAFQGWGATNTAVSQDSENLQPEKYSESDEKRYVELSERELNGMLANNTDLAQKLAIDLSRDLASAKLLIPLDPDFPVMGGKTLKVAAGLELAYANQRPVVILKGVSIMGVPIPGAWLGGLKNVDLISEFGDSGFWQAFAEGVELIKVEDSNLVIKLKE